MLVPAARQTQNTVPQAFGDLSRTFTYPLLLLTRAADFTLAQLPHGRAHPTQGNAATGLRYRPPHTFRRITCATASQMALPALRLLVLAAATAAVRAVSDPLSVSMVQDGAGFTVTAVAEAGITSYGSTACGILSFPDYEPRGWVIETPTAPNAQDEVVFWFAPEGGLLVDGETVTLYCFFRDRVTGIECAYDMYGSSGRLPCPCGRGTT
jgi:hypothetical protein